MSIAEMTGIDLQTEVERKIAKNSARIYQRDDTSGVMVRIAEGAS